MKNLFLIHLILHIANILAQDTTICSYTDVTSCQNDKSCLWDKLQVCNNKKDCPQVQLSKCDSNKVCRSTPSTEGVCSAPVAHCKPYDFKQCNNDALCYWLSIYKCVPKDPQPVIPKCSVMDPIDCKKNNDFCDLSGQCFENQQFCQGLEHNQCVKDPSCIYTMTQKQQCQDNPKFCKSLNLKQCLKNNLYCNAAQTIPQCVNQFQCDGLSYDKCKKNSQYCQNIQKFTCKPKKNVCGFLTDPDQCKLAGCSGSYSNGQFNCQFATPCDDYDEVKCKANQNMCVYSPGPFICKNNIECGNIGDPNLCKLNKYCKYIPSEFECLPIKQKCSKLSSDECQNNPSCIYTPAQGYCSQYKDFGCKDLSLQQCYKDSHCITRYECTQEKIPNCNELGQDDCKQESLFCDLQERGNCNDNTYNCNLKETQCLYTKPCTWTPGIKGQCLNIQQCSSLLKDACKANDVYCTYNKDGYCRPK